VWHVILGWEGKHGEAGDSGLVLVSHGAGLHSADLSQLQRHDNHTLSRCCSKCK
jgi:hypothetical protein